MPTKESVRLHIDEVESLLKENPIPVEKIKKAVRKFSEECRKENEELRELKDDLFNKGVENDFEF